MNICCGEMVAVKRVVKNNCELSGKKTNRFKMSLYIHKGVVNTKSSTNLHNNNY